jgi:hypothetical protein
MIEMSEVTIATFCLFCLPLIVAPDQIQKNSGFISSKVRGPGSDEVQCGLGIPTESQSAGSAGQCSLACKRFNGCKWFNFIEGCSSGQTCSRGICQLFDYPPPIGSKQGCALYQVRLAQSAILIVDSKLFSIRLIQIF